MAVSNHGVLFDHPVYMNLSILINLYSISTELQIVLGQSPRETQNFSDRAYKKRQKQTSSSYVECRK